MLKVLLSFGALFAGSYTAVTVSRTVYSGIGIALPVGAALKSTPDPANIWSWHETITIDPNATVNADVLVDFDQNGRMDSEIAEMRVLITDMQVSITPVRSDDSQSFPEVLLLDAGGVRWDLTPVPHAGTQTGLRGIASTAHLSTPLVLPVGSGLTVRATNGGTNAATRVLRVNMVGRVVNL